MHKAIGNLWDFHKEGYTVVIPTNLYITTNGNIMGAGLAKDAAERWPLLREEYTSRIRLGMPRVWDPGKHIILLPVKPSMTRDGWPGWMGKANVSMIEDGVQWMNEMKFGKRPIACPLLGCGAGWLAKKDILPILERLDHRFTIVFPEEKS